MMKGRPHVVLLAGAGLVVGVLLLYPPWQCSRSNSVYMGRHFFLAAYTEVPLVRETSWDTGEICDNPVVAWGRQFRSIGIVGAISFGLAGYRGLRSRRTRDTVGS